MCGFVLGIVLYQASGGGKGESSTAIKALLEGSIDDCSAPRLVNDECPAGYDPVGDSSCYAPNGKVCIYEGHQSTCGAGACLPVSAWYCCNLGTCSSVLSQGQCATGNLFDNELACTTSCSDLPPPTSYYCCKDNLCTAKPDDQSSYDFCTDPNAIPSPDPTCGGSCAVATSASASTSASSTHYCCVNGACAGPQSTACSTVAATYPDHAQCTAGCMQSSASTSASQPLCCNGNQCVPYLAVSSFSTSSSASMISLNASSAPTLFCAGIFPACGGMCTPTTTCTPKDGHCICL